MKKKRIVNLIIFVAVSFATILSCYLSDSIGEKQSLKWRSILSENVMALTAEDAGVVGQIFTCYERISSEQVYGDVFNVKYCGTCDDVPVTKVWGEKQCRK